MRYRKKDRKRRDGKDNRICAAAGRLAALGAGLLLGGFCAAFPSQAKEMLLLQTEASFLPQAGEADWEGGSCAQETDTLSDNNVPRKNPPQDAQNSEKAADRGTSDTDEEDTQNPDAPTADTSKIPRITVQPEDVRVEAGGYASFHVSAVGENLTYQWMVDKGDGSGFQNVAGAGEALYRVMVFDGSMNGYAYKCIVTSEDETSQQGDGNNGYGSSKNGSQGGNKKNYVESRAALLTIYYRIVGGARSVWVKSSGRGLDFQGSGAYSKLSGVSVDGSRITAGEYNKGGSQSLFTQITLLRSYLETLAEGEHEIEIIWEDGTAKTSFHIAPPAANLPAESLGLGRPGDDAAGSSRAAGTTAAGKEAGSANRAADMTDGEKEDEKKEEEREGDDIKSARDDAEQSEAGQNQISENTIDTSVSENMLIPHSGTAADVLQASGVAALMPTEKMTAAPDIRETKKRSPDDETNTPQPAGMSGTADQYARKLCLAVILISTVGILCGLITYRLHDVEGRKDCINSQMGNLCSRE